MLNAVAAVNEVQGIAVSLEENVSETLGVAPLPEQLVKEPSK
jgi:hypothetical protein